MTCDDKRTTTVVVFKIVVQGSSYDVVWEKTDKVDELKNIVESL